MPLQKQNINISFSQGLDTKTDPRQVMPGRVEVMKNSKFTKGMEFNKRDGHAQITDIDESQACFVTNSVSAYESEILSFGDQSLFSFTPENNTNANKGQTQPVDLTVQEYFSQSLVSEFDVIMTSINSGYLLYAFGAGLYSIISLSTGQTIIDKEVIPFLSSGVTVLRTNILGKWFFIFFIDKMNNKLMLTALDTTANFAATSVTLFSAPGTILNAFDIGRANDGIHINAAVSYAGQNVGLVAIDASLTISTSTVHIGAPFGADEIAVVGFIARDLSNNTLFGVSDRHNIAVFGINGVTAAVTSGPTTTATGMNRIVNITGNDILNQSQFPMYFETQETYGSFAGGGTNDRLTNHIWVQTITFGSLSFSTTNVLQYGASIFIKPGSITNTNGSGYMFIGIRYGGKNASSSELNQNLENTYFVVLHHIYENNALVNADCLDQFTPIAKVDQGNAIPYPDILSLDAFGGPINSELPQIYAANFNSSVVSSIGPIPFIQFGYFGVTNVTTQQGLPTPAGYSAFSGFMDFNSNNAFQFQEAGNVLQYTGGFVSMYDGALPYEQNFHLFPEDIATSFIDMTSPGVPKNPVDTPYLYIAVYRWQDARGRIHRSSASEAYKLDTSGATGPLTTNNIQVPFIRITKKLSNIPSPITKNTVEIDIYRNTPTAPGGNPIDIFYKIGSIHQINTDADSGVFNDTTADADIIGNELLYTTGGVVNNFGGPPASSITIYRGRLLVVDAEDRNTIWFSKPLLETTPVEFSEGFTLFCDPRFGPITAINVLDDKLIAFKENAIFYFTGNGPDNTGANNDFSDAYLISSNAGCVDPKSTVVMQDGIMFKSNKGIYLLDRGLGVSYIGAPVESFNSSHVVGAELVPNSTQIQFALDDDQTVLMFDYFYKQWSTFVGYDVAASTVYKNLYTYIDPNGTVFQETPDTFNDAGAGFYQSLVTSWLSLSGFQGYQRIYRLYFLGKFITPHLVRVDIYYDFNETVAQSMILNATQLNASVGTDIEQFRINIDRQKCQSIKIALTELPDPSNPTPGAGLTLEAIGVVVGIKLTYPKLPAAQSVTS